jgi:hypothetical protein
LRATKAGCQLLIDESGIVVIDYLVYKLGPTSKKEPFTYGEEISRQNRSLAKSVSAPPIQ